MSAIKPLAIIADDLTGATDAAVAFAARAYPTRLLLDLAYAEDVDFVAVNSESRHLSPDDAAEQVRRVVRPFSASHQLYKKIDSTLRGNPAAELFALMEATGESRALIAPAFTAQGRTTIDGHQLLHGVPLEETSFGAEIATSNLVELFRRRGDPGTPRLLTLADVRSPSGDVATLLADPAPGLIIADAVTDDDLDAIAGAALDAGIRLLCGSAGLSHALARRLPLREIRFPRQAERVRFAPILAIAGSRQAETIAQVDEACASNAFVLTPATLEPSMAEALLGQIVPQLRLGVNTVVATHLLDAATKDEQAVAEWLARLVKLIDRRVDIGGLILTGGDVASAVCRHLGVRAIDLYGEIQPGIPWGIARGGKLDRKLIATKAGGFGNRSALVDSINFLMGDR